MYQMMDPGFVGLIFSCFNNDAASAVGITIFTSIITILSKYLKNACMEGKNKNVFLYFSIHYECKFPFSGK
jgi:hypothetical protein